MLWSTGVKAAPRHGIAFGASVALHLTIAGAALVGSFFPTFEMPEIEFELTEVTLLDPDAIQGDDGPGEMEPPPIPEPPPPPPSPPEVPPPEGGLEPAPPPPSKPSDAPDPNASATTPAEPNRSLGRKNSHVDRLGPANSTFYFLLVPAKIRKMAHAEAAMDIMASFPDFEYLVDAGGFDPLRDFDHLVISTPNITDPRQTFLVVDYKMNRDDVRRTIERAATRRGEVIEWLDEDGVVRGNPRPADPTREDWDPRWFVLPEDTKIAAYIREEFVPSLLKEDVGPEKTASNYVANLAKLRRFAGRIPTAGFQFLQKDIYAALKSVRGLPFPLPDALEVTMEAAEEPELLIRATFLNDGDAKATELWMRDELPRIINSNILYKLKMKWIYELFEIERDGADLKLWAQLDADQTKLLLTLARDLVAKVQRKDPAELEASRQQRAENWKKRKGGKLPPTALDELEADAAASTRPASGTASRAEPRGDAPAAPTPAARDLPPVQPVLPPR